MHAVLKLSAAIDAVNARVGLALRWLVLAMVLVSAGAAVARYALNIGSNAWVELQWYLFSAVFLLGAGHTLLRNEHVRIDVLSARLPRRAQIWVDVLGLVAFLFPVAAIILVLSWPPFVSSLASGEVSSDAGGLLRWPARLLIPLGFGLLLLQGVSELIKKLAILTGHRPDPAAEGGA
jgi:TRAP-type mannitol/chloroaromatic compound transport system permease small subunit